MTIAKLTRAGWKESSPGTPQRPVGDSLTWGDRQPEAVLEEQKPRFEVNFRIRTLTAVWNEIDVPNHTSMRSIGREQARWGITGEIAARHEGPMNPLLGDQQAKLYLYHVIHDAYVDAPKPAVTGAWYYEEELELEVAGSPHVGLIVDLMRSYNPDKAKVLADVCAERGLTGAAFQLQRKPSADMRFVIDSLAMAAGVRSYRIFTAHQDWKRGWLMPDDDQDLPLERRNAVPVEEGLAMPSELRHALLPAEPNQGETRLFRATGRFLRISGNGKEIQLSPNVDCFRNTAEELVVTRGGLVSLMYEGTCWTLSGAVGQRFPDNSLATPHFPDILRAPEEGVTVPRAGTLAAIYDPLMLGEDSLAVFVNEIYRPGWKGMLLGVGARMEVRYGAAQPAFNNVTSRSLVVVTRG